MDGHRGAGAVKKVIVAIVVCMLGLVALLFATVALLGGGTGLEPSQLASNEIPADLLPLYEAAAQTCSGMDWTLLAAVHKTETSFGRGPVTSSAGAQGPMQFMPETFAAYGVDGDGNASVETNDVEDAVFSAANYLCANGAGDPTRCVRDRAVALQPRPRLRRTGRDPCGVVWSGASAIWRGSGTSVLQLDPRQSQHHAYRPSTPGCLSRRH